MIGRSCRLTPTPWPNCNPNAATSSVKPNSVASGHTAATSSVPAPGRTAAITAIKPGVSTDQVARLWPTAQDIGLPDEKTAFGLQFGHGLGLCLHERPIISRLVSLDHPMEIKTGMVFALETYCPAKDGFSAARIEEEVVVTDKGCQVITLFPAEDLPIANRY